ncbi:hypothetical protein LZL11_24160 [Pseudomonas aeruginosa]|uniref:hypothetical protein n=1 Tax=Pseudomonas aeruginosa TaxID=287 RepID=UPI0021B02B07|nr:hypothetical protein [Pseudomonas aeruginosa]MCT5287591.1 hypothetical protein [Pseudomonas aeruginosa]MCT5909178.1 hypothetical protein [Pseudomonas aeruginosa]
MEQAMRDKFEAWVTAAMGGYADLRKSNDPNFAYDDADVDFAYQAWQASRAALRVELPPSVTIEEVAEHLGMDDVDVVDIAHMVNGAIAACAAFIKQAGIEVK